MTIKDFLQLAVRVLHAFVVFALLAMALLVIVFPWDEPQPRLDVSDHAYSDNGKGIWDEQKNNR